MLDGLLQTWVMRNIFIPVFDIGILAFIFYKSYQILVQTRAVQLIRGTILLLLTYGVAFVLQLQTLLWVLNLIVPSLVIGLAIIFQPELRKIFTRIGQGQLFKPRANTQGLPIDDIIKTAQSLSETRRGGLIVFSRSVGLKNIMETGSKLDAEVSSALLLSIFSYDTPLHDGAVIIENGRIAAAGCFLPLSEQQDIRKSFGTRHRAALGLVEETDSVVLIVSEETGAISIANEGVLHYGMELHEVKHMIASLLNIKSDPETVREARLED